MRTAKAGTGKKRIPVRTTYMEMLDGPASPGAEHPRAHRLPRLLNHHPPRPDLTVIRARSPSVRYYRFLYDSVGTDWSWFDRKLMSDRELNGIIKDDLVEIDVLHAGGVPAGFSELDLRRPGEVEIVYLGIMPEFMRQGLGVYLVDWTVRRAWSHEPQRVWLHTCELDHDAAIPLYLKAGFEVYDERVVLQPVPDDRTPEQQ